MRRNCSVAMTKPMPSSKSSAGLGCDTQAADSSRPGSSGSPRAVRGRRGLGASGPRGASPRLDTASSSSASLASTPGPAPLGGERLRISRVHSALPRCAPVEHRGLPPWRVVSALRDRLSIRSSLCCVRNKRECFDSGFPLSSSEAVSTVRPGAGLKFIRWSSPIRDDQQTT